MDNTDTLVFVLGRILAAIAQLAVIIGCIILVTKQKNTATVLMLIGSILSLVFSILSVSGSLIAANQGTDELLLWTKLYAVMGPLPYLLFGIGIVLFALKYAKKDSDGQKSI